MTIPNCNAVEDPCAGCYFLELAIPRRGAHLSNKTFAYEITFYMLLINELIVSS